MVSHACYSGNDFECLNNSFNYNIQHEVDCYLSHETKHKMICSSKSVHNEHARAYTGRSVNTLETFYETDMPTLFD